MCGILGVIGRPAIKEQFTEALTELSHRGPDDAGVYQEGTILLGLRRLAILDLSSHGYQPMRDDRSGAVITYNGEVYNYLELRKELESLGWNFKSGTDTEVVLKSVLQWGDGALQKFNGMWAFAVWLPKEGRVFLARDRFGIKPFYYILTDGLLAFASEPKALLKLFPEYRSVDTATLYDFLANGNLCTGESSFYEGIKVLPPAHCANYHVPTNRLRIQRYWDYPDYLETNTTADEIERFSELLNSAVSLRLRSDVPLGLSLSGGLDSTAVLAASQESNNDNITCYTSVYSDRDRGEASWARAAASRYGMVPVEVEASGDQWVDTLRKIVWHMDSPGFSPAVFPLWYLMAEAKRQGTVVVLEGQGADEALGGYASYSMINLLALIGRFLVSGKELREIGVAYKGAVKTFGRNLARLWLLRTMFPFLLPLHRRRSGALSVLRSDFVSAMRSRPEAESRPPKNMDMVTRALWFDHSRRVLPSELHYGDAISMAHSVESRLPFMDYRLVEWLFSHSAKLKIANGETKWILRQYLRKAGQITIAERLDKQGYHTPADQWLSAENGRLLREFLLEPSAKILEYADLSKINRLITIHLKGRFNAGNYLYRLLTTELWLLECISGKRNNVSPQSINIASTRGTL